MINIAFFWCNPRLTLVLEGYKHRFYCYSLLTNKYGLDFGYFFIYDLSNVSILSISINNED